MQLRKIVWLLVGTWICAATGCASLSSWNWKKQDEVELEHPAKIVAIWSNSVFSEAGKKPVRGLGGRIYFYDGKHNPTQVDGKLSVFLYDDSQPQGREKQEASKTVHFSPEEVAAKYTPTEFGASYSFWVPWDEVGGDRTQLGVIPVFTSAKGEMLVGEQARIILPGKEPIEFETGEDHGSDIQQAQFVGGESQAARQKQAADDAKQRIKSTTIKLPPSMQQRLRMSSAPRRSVSEKAQTVLQSRGANDRRSTLGQSTVTGRNAGTGFPSSAPARQAGPSVSPERMTPETITRLPSAGSQSASRPVQARQSARQGLSHGQKPLRLGGLPFGR